MTPDPKRTAQAFRFYAALLKFYPASFQCEYGDTLALQFRDEYREVLVSGKQSALFRFWLFILFDFVRSLLSEVLEEGVKMFRKNFFIFTALGSGILGFLIFIFMYGPYYETFDIGSWVLLFWPTFLILTALTLFGIARAIHSNILFRVLAIVALLAAFVFFPIPQQSWRGWEYNTLIEYIGGSEDTAFGFIFPAYFIMLLIFAILTLVKKKWLPGAALLLLCVPILIPYIGFWLSIKIPFVVQGEGEWFAITYGILWPVVWFTIAGWLLRKENIEQPVQGAVEAA